MCVCLRVQCMESWPGSALALGLKAWVAEACLGFAPLPPPPPSAWSYPLLWNWKLHK